MTDNLEFRALFSLPPIALSASTALATVQTPTPKNETGDRELDAVLWLRDCIKTAHPALIAAALEAFKKIKTPAKDLERRYSDYLIRASGGNTLAAVFGGFDFANLEGLAQSSVKKKARQDEALARFGSEKALFEMTPAETLCKKAVRGLKRDKEWGVYDLEEAAARFAKRPELVPHTLSDCLYEQDYWDSLYWLRNDFSTYTSDADPAGRAHDDYCFAMLAKIPPRSKEEALQVYQHLEDKEGMDRDETPDILRNLIVSGWPVEDTN